FHVTGVQTWALPIFEKQVQPGTLLGQAAGVLLVGGPVPDVLAGVHDVPVAADDVVAAAGQPPVEDRRDPVHAAELELLPLVAGRSEERRVGKEARSE